MHKTTTSKKKKKKKKKKIENVFMKHYAPNHMFVPKEGSSQNMKVRKECNSTQLKS